MPYIVELKMRDTRWEFETPEERDAKYNSLVEAAAPLDVPLDHVILLKIDTQLSEFTGNIEEKIVG